MKIIDTRQDSPTFGQIIDFEAVDFVRGVIQAKVYQSKYNSPIEQILLSNLTGSDKAMIDVIVRDAQLSGEFVGWTKLEEYSDWLFPEKAKRIYLTEADVAFFTANHIEFVNMIYAEPKNPYVKINGGYEVYLNTIVEEALPLLEQRGIVVQEKPIEL